MPDEKTIPPLLVIAGLRGFGKSHYVYLNIDHSKPILCLDFRGQMAKKFNQPETKSRFGMMDQLRHDTTPQVFYRPGQEDYPIGGEGGDIDYFLINASCCENIQIIIDELDYAIPNHRYPNSFPKFLDDSRTQNLPVYITCHRIHEGSPKLRALADFVCFRMQSKKDLNFLEELGEKEKVDQIKKLKRFEFVIISPELQE